MFNIFFWNHWNSYENRIQRCMKRYNHDKALFYSRKLIEDKKTPENYFQHGMILILKNPMKPIEAGEAFTKAYKLLIL